MVPRPLPLAAAVAVAQLMGLVVVVVVVLACFSIHGRAAGWRRRRGRPGGACLHGHEGGGQVVLLHAAGCKGYIAGAAGGGTRGISGGGGGSVRVALSGLHGASCQVFCLVGLHECESRGEGRRCVR